jgi:membrane-associated protease RseP (regulator of RpoE activity)
VTTVMWVVGLLLFVLGLLFSIAWHELGHLSTAKLFGIRVPQYMVGFGRTIWSRKRGETEYGLKAIPLGGYIRMIGMFPPGADGRVTQRSTSPWRTMIEDAREASYEEIKPGDEDRMFYTRKPWKRVIVMFAGPFMNLVLALVIFFGLFMAVGVPTATPKVNVVSQCVVAAGQPTDTCPAAAPAAPAAAAGLLPGDTVVSFDGDPISDYAQLQADIRESPGRTVPIVVRRDGRTLTLTATLTSNTVAKLDRDGYQVKGETVTAGFLGIQPVIGVDHLSFGESLDRMADITKHSATALVRLPGKIPGLWHSVVSDDPRPADSPMGMIGAARIGGEIFEGDQPISDKLYQLVSVLGMVNLGLFLFNMLPLLPLDGGHIAGALWESLRRKAAALLRRPDPGPFDVARLMPAAYVVAAVFICFTALVGVADVVNPIRLN